MKRFLAIGTFVTAALLFLGGCKKSLEPLPYNNDGSAVTLTASKNAVAPTIADSTNKLLALKWTSPNYSTDSNTYKFVVEIDSSGRNFAKAVRREVTGKLTDSITGRDLNAILLNNGFSIGTAYNLDIRVVSSYANNNERYTSNIVKVAVTPYADPSVLSTQFTSVTGTAATSTNVSNTFSWSRSFTGYTGAITYSLQYDSAGKNFVAPQEITAGTSTSNKALTQDEMNTTALASGIAIGNSGKVEYRLKATTANGAVAYSNIVNVTVTTFSPVPPNLYIVGDATPGGWNNPVPTPSQQFTKVDAYTFSITIGLNAGGSYLLLPVNGSWDHKYGGATDGTTGSGGTLLKDGAVPGSNTPAPAASGVYKIVVNFQTNKYTVTQIAVPSNLYIVGDATAGGWANPVPVPSQQFSRIDNVSYGIVVNLTAGNSYLFLPLNGNWDHKYGGATDGTASSGGALLADGAVPGSNTPAPSTSGLYKIIVNFATNSYSVTPYTGPSSLYIVGDATPGGWANPVPAPSQQFTKIKEGEFQLNIPLTAGGSYLLLPVNGSWDHKYGGATDGVSSNGVLLADGAVPGSNTPAPATSGNRTITVSFITNTYKVQ
jgi:hypothetical protein